MDTPSNTKYLRSCTLKSRTTVEREVKENATQQLSYEIRAVQELEMCKEVKAEDIRKNE